MAAADQKCDAGGALPRWLDIPWNTGVRRACSRFARHSAVLVLIVLSTAVTGCATRSGAELLIPQTVAAAGLPTLRLLAVTDREIDASAQSYGGGRGGLSYDAFTLAVAPVSPPDDQGKPVQDAGGNIRAEFITQDRQGLDRAGFLSAVAERSAEARQPVLVFVHGYNHSYQEALFTLARVEMGADAPTTSILFSWPSEANPAGYAADRDAATYARDDLANLLSDLAEAPDRPILVSGHSMGAWLVMEVVRQLKLLGREDIIDRLQIGLAAPDIDVDVFRAQMAVIGPVSLTVLVSADDRALALSRRLSLGRQRLGAVSVDDPGVQQMAQDLGIRIIDISAAPAGDRFKHDRFLFLSVLHAERGDEPDLFMLRRMGRVGTYILNGAGIALPAQLPRPEDSEDELQ